jgi:RNA polymerase sigma-70 factor, ECF subfamily
MSWFCQRQAFFCGECLISFGSKHLTYRQDSRKKGRTTLSRQEDKNGGFLALLLPLQRSLEVYCRRMLRNPSQVEDVLQTAMMEAFARFDRYAEGTNFRAWIFRFVTLEIFNRNRKREPILFADARNDVPAQPLEEIPEDAVAAMLEDPGPIMEHFEDQVVKALWQLTHSERAVLLLRAIGEFTYQEMHEVLSIPLGSVMGYLSRARQKMRQSLADYSAKHYLARRKEPRP